MYQLLHVFGVDAGAFEGAFGGAYGCRHPSYAQLKGAVRAAEGTLSAFRDTVCTRGGLIMTETLKHTATAVNPVSVI